jgi:hypothetical protein
VSHFDFPDQLLVEVAHLDIGDGLGMEVNLGELADDLVLHRLGGEVPRVVVQHRDPVKVARLPVEHAPHLLRASMPRIDVGMGLDSNPTKGRHMNVERAQGDLSVCAPAPFDQSGYGVEDRSDPREHRRRPEMPTGIGEGARYPLSD